MALRVCTGGVVNADCVSWGIVTGFGRYGSGVVGWLLDGPLAQLVELLTFNQ